MRTDRAWWVVLLLGLCTCAIYSIWWWAEIGNDLNTLMPEEKATTNYWLVWFLLGPITCDIWVLVWHSQVSDKIGRACRKYGSAYTMSSSDYWIWVILLSFIVAGPWIYINKVCDCMNSVCGIYNSRGNGGYVGY